VKVEQRNERLLDHNLATVREHTVAGIAHISYQGLLCVIADVLDTAVRDGDCFLTLGVTKANDALLLTVRQGNGRAYAGGVNLTELSKDAEKLLPPL